MKGIIPYLNFNGRGFEALDFYCKALDGKILFAQSMGDSPMGAQTPDEFKNRLMHGSFECEAGMFMASDGQPGRPVITGDNVNLSLHFEEVSKAEKAFNALAEGGQVLMPLQETFWALRFGMLIDKYGFNWMFNIDKPQA